MFAYKFQPIISTDGNGNIDITLPSENEKITINFSTTKNELIITTNDPLKVFLKGNNITLPDESECENNN